MASQKERKIPKKQKHKIAAAKGNIGVLHFHHYILPSCRYTVVVLHFSCQQRCSGLTSNPSQFLSKDSTFLKKKNDGDE